MDGKTLGDVFQLVNDSVQNERRKLAERLRGLRAYEIGSYEESAGEYGWLVLREDVEAIIAELEGETGGDS